MLEAFKSFSTVVVTWLSILLTVWFAYYTFRYQSTTSVKKEQLYKVYLPMFTLMEPFLYKETKDVGIHQLNNLLSKLNKICESHYELVDPRIISYIRKINRSIRHSDYDEVEVNKMYKRLCSKIDYGFESTRKRLGLPVRNVYYKLDENQYEDKLDLAHYLFLITWKGLIFILLMLFLTNWIINIA
ncbi:hypothetical protein ACP2W0_12775 [Pseudobacillus badius]|uniref:hypothetical protein n=1 Tax=Bacillus badius TaxID=1455 RepID=UPI003CF8F369